MTYVKFIIFISHPFMFSGIKDTLFKLLSHFIRISFFSLKISEATNDLLFLLPSVSILRQLKRGLIFKKSLSSKTSVRPFQMKTFKSQ